MIIDPSIRNSLAAAFVAALLAAVASQPARSEPATYKLDPEHLSVGFLVHHIGYAKVLGTFRNASGSYVFDEKIGRLSDVKIVVDTASVFTNHKKRDDHLRSADFLNSSEFPQMVFTAADAKRTGERTFAIEGKLDLLGKSKPLVLEATWNKSGDYPIPPKGYAMGVSARGSFKRSAHGMMYAVDNGWVGDQVELIIEFEARRQ
jgi:polyisoprenoid-binding protein YceI